jgi:hypothetical protein
MGSGDVDTRKKMAELCESLVRVLIVFPSRTLSVGGESLTSQVSGTVSMAQRASTSLPRSRCDCCSTCAFLRPHQCFTDDVDVCRDRVH